MKHRAKQIPTVSRLCGDTIVELLYDSKRRETALVVASAGQWRIVGDFKTEEGDVLVPYAASNNLIRHECVLLPSKPAASGDKAELIADIVAYLHRYVDLPHTFERLVAHYVLLTWVNDAFNELPHLRFQGDFGSGKTRALLAVGSVAYKGFFASGASTVSPIFHTLDQFGGTLVLDEADLRLSDKTAGIVKILNNGTVKGLPVLRSLQNAKKEFNPAAFTVFGPKIIAMRGSFKDQALESRFLTETMGLRPLRDDIPIQLPDALKAEALTLRNRLLHFRLTNLFSIRSDTSRVVSGIVPRLNQTAVSLASLIDDTELLAEFETLLRARDAELAAAPSAGSPKNVLAAFAVAASESSRAFVPITEIVGRLNRDAPSPVSPRLVGRILRENSIPLHKSNGKMVALSPLARGAQQNPLPDL